MAMTNLAKGYGDYRRPQLGPPLSFAVAILATAAAGAFASGALHADSVMPLAATALFAFAAVAAIAGLRQRRPRPAPALNYFDVAGALTLIGIGCAALIDPEQMVRLVAGTR